MLAILSPMKRIQSIDLIALIGLVLLLFLISAIIGNHFISIQEWIVAGSKK